MLRSSLFCLLERMFWTAWNITTVNVYLTSRGLTKELEKCIHLPFWNQNSWIPWKFLVDERKGKQRAFQLWWRPVPKIFIDIIFLPRCEKHASDEKPSYWKMLGTWDPKWQWCISICHCIPEVPTCTSEWLTRRRGNSAWQKVSPLAWRAFLFFFFFKDESSCVDSLSFLFLF